MVKKTVIVSVSMPSELAEFMDEQNLSPSQLIQDKILEQKKLFENFASEKGRILQNLQSLQKEYANVITFLDTLGKFEEFQKWRGQHVLAQKE